jgi:hypothetical protein
MMHGTTVRLGVHGCCRKHTAALPRYSILVSGTAATCMHPQLRRDVHRLVAETQYQCAVAEKDAYAQCNSTVVAAYYNILPRG